jgi:L-cystine uptake protein TcyP (sodium:dicarboxylate symporter family)
LKRGRESLAEAAVVERRGYVLRSNEVRSMRKCPSLKADAMDTLVKPLTPTSTFIDSSLVHPSSISLVFIFATCLGASSSWLRDADISTLYSQPRHCFAP